MRGGSHTRLVSPKETGMDEAGEDQGVSVTRVGPRSIRDLPAAQRRAIHGWSMYDWANSGLILS